MKSIRPIINTSLLMLAISQIYITGPISLATLNKHAGNIPVVSASKIRALTTKPESATERPYFEAGVLVGDYLSLIVVYSLIYCLILALRNSARASSVNTNSAQDRAECDHANVLIIGLRLVIPLSAIESKQASREQPHVN